MERRLGVREKKTSSPRRRAGADTRAEPETQTPDIINLRAAVRELQDAVVKSLVGAATSALLGRSCA